MAEDSNGMAFEDIPLEDARRMGRGPRMEPMLYQIPPDLVVNFQPIDIIDVIL